MGFVISVKNYFSVARTLALDGDNFSASDVFFHKKATQVEVFGLYLQEMR